MPFGEAGGMHDEIMTMGWGLGAWKLEDNRGRGKRGGRSCYHHQLNISIEASLRILVYVLISISVSVSAFVPALELPHAAGPLYIPHPPLRRHKE